jgi:hypothetical protein
VEVGMVDMVRVVWIFCSVKEKKCVVGIGKKKADCGVFCAERLFSATSLLDPRAGLSLRSTSKKHETLMTAIYYITLPI